MSPVHYHLGWALAAAVFFLMALYVLVCRQVLLVYSRKLLLETTPEERHAELERHVDREDDYTSSLRTLDHLLRLGMILTLAFGRFMILTIDDARGGSVGESISVGRSLLACTVLAVEIAAVLLLLELAARIVARVQPEACFARLIGGIDRMHRLVAPLRSVIERLVGAVVKALGGGDRTSADILEEEILSAAEEGEKEGLLDGKDIDMIEAIITFGGVEVSEVMTPRTEMLGLDVEDSFEVNLARAIECGHSRIPVFRESKDNIIGILYVKDLLRYWNEKDSIELEEILRESHFVSPTKKIDELLQEFKSERFHIAIVRDEFGGTSGLITIEDVIEEIVGEISDEYEPEPAASFTRVGHGVVEVDAALRVQELNEKLSLDLPEEESYDTIGGFLFIRMGRIPDAGETFECDSGVFEVTVAEERRIRRVRIRLPQKDEAPRAGDAPRPAAK